jgi:hypothetical protein
MTLRIDYQSEGFPVGGPVSNGWATLTTSWAELLTAAVTVGRPNRQYVFKHGVVSRYEALFRLSLVRMALEQAGPRAWRLRRTESARTLDPSEKGAISYFLGLAVAGLFARRVLDAPWMMHLDVFRPLLNPVLRGRSRPDLVGQTQSGDWIALECKGRVSAPSADAKDKAKAQAQRLVSVNGISPILRVGAITYLSKETLQFFWRDPDPDREVRNPIEVEADPSVWRYHYTPVLELIRSIPNAYETMRRRAEIQRVEEADLDIGIHPRVIEALENPNRADPRPDAGSFDNDDRYAPDGIALVAGESWQRPFEETEGQ